MCGISTAPAHAPLLAGAVLLGGQRDRRHGNRRSPSAKCEHPAPPGSSSIAATINAATRSRYIPVYGPITCGCPTWKSVSSALSAATAAPMSGHCLSRRAWARTPSNAQDAPLTGLDDGDDPAHPLKGHRREVGQEGEGGNERVGAGYLGPAPYLSSSGCTHFLARLS